MTATKAALAILVGFAALLIAFTNQHFYWGRSRYFGTSAKEAPRWVGRLLFGVIGALFILVGMRFFVFGY